MSRKKWLFVLVLLLTAWQVIALYLGTKDNYNISRLKNWNAEITRWSSGAPVTFLGYISDDLGEVQSVEFIGRHIGDAEMSVIAELKSCNLVRFKNCTFQNGKLFRQLYRMTNLSVVQFVNNSIDDAFFIDALSCLNTTKFLSIYNENTSDLSIDAIANMPSLKSVTVINSNITPEGLGRLHAAKPDVVISP